MVDPSNVPGHGVTTGMVTLPLLLISELRGKFPNVVVNSSYSYTILNVNSNIFLILIQRSQWKPDQLQSGFQRTEYNMLGPTLLSLCRGGGSHQPDHLFQKQLCCGSLLQTVLHYGYWWAPKNRSDIDTNEDCIIWHIQYYLYQQSVKRCANNMIHFCPVWELEVNLWQ